MWFRVSLSHLMWISLLIESTLGMLTLPDTFKEGNTVTELVSLRILDAHSQGDRLRRDVTSNFPDYISCELRVSEEPIKLDLERNRNIDVTNSVYVMRNGGIFLEAISTMKDVGYFQDRENKAAFAVVCEPRRDGSCAYRVEGIVAKAGEILLVYPKEEEEQQQQNQKQKYGEGESHYVAEKINPAAINFGDYIILDSIPRSVPETLRRVRRQATKINYNVELMMVTDSSVFSFWYERTEASTPADRRTLTLSRITQYYAFILNAIDLRYKNINETDLALNVLYSGLLIVEDPAVSNWTAGISTNNPDDASRPLVDADQALTSFTTWVQGRTDLPQSDHVMLFTAFDLFYQGSTANAGLAFVGAICGQASTSISENRFDFNGATVAAHELGHSLGAVHDGDNNACQATDSFIMAPSSGLSTDATAQNPWYFSPCSVSDFRKQIDSLDNDANNCLLVESPSLDPTALTPHLQDPPGQEYSIDTQCAYYLGTGSTFCRSFYNETSYPEICGGLFCSIPGTNGCRKTVPARGTSCGPNKWCDSGACVYSADAPDVPAFCPLGEYPGIISGLNLTCAQMIQSRGDVCYQESHNQRCCESCPTIQTGITNCQFGDKSPSCGAITPGQCYSPQNEELCCGTCAGFKRVDLPDCQFGDKSSSCSAITPGHCYFPNNEELCCGTCAGFKRVDLPADCEYGDRASSCAGITATSCYNNQNANLCCETCYNFVTNIPATTAPTTTTSTTPSATTVPTTTSTTPPTTTMPTTTTTRSTTPLATTVPTTTISTTPPATTVPTTTSTTPPATTVPTTTTTTPPATTMPTTTTSTTSPATTVLTTTSTIPQATTVTTTTTASTTPLATTVPTTETSTTRPATTMPTTTTSTTQPATTMPTTTTSTTPSVTTMPTTTTTTSTTPPATTMPTTTTGTTPPATTMPTTKTSTTQPATTVSTTPTSTTPPATTMPTTTTSTTPPATTMPTTTTSATQTTTTVPTTTTTSTTPPATNVPTTTTSTSPPSTTEPATTTSTTPPATTMPTSTTPPATTAPTTSTSTSEPVTTVITSTTSATQPSTTVPTDTTSPSVAGTDKSASTTSTIKSIVPTTATNSRSTSTDEETTTIGIATTTEPPGTSTVHTSKPHEPGTTQTTPTTTSIKPTSYSVRNDTVTVIMTTDEVTTGMNITVNTGVNTTDPAPPTSVWEEWAGIIAGMSAGFGLLVLAPSLVCCLLKCRRQTKDPMDETSETGYVEITPLGSVAGYTDRNWQPGYVWTGQLNRGYTENGRPQKTRQQKENVANHSLARVGTETKSRTTEKDGKNQHHSEKHGFQHGSKGTSLIPGFHHANSEAEGFLNKAFLSGDSGVSSVSGTNGNARMKMHEVNERFFKNSGFSYGM